MMPDTIILRSWLKPRVRQENTPGTFFGMVDGKQYVAIASGGRMWQYMQKIGDWIVACKLPD